MPRIAAQFYLDLFDLDAGVDRVRAGPVVVDRGDRTREEFEALLCKAIAAAAKLSLDELEADR
jgi:hypothetical protein